MNTLLGFCPAPPEWRVNWAALDQTYEWVRALKSCPQDAQWHAEGDVWIHTQMVLDELAHMEAWRTLIQEERELVFLTALLHDVSKPETTREEENGRITAKGHSKKGALRARRVLWNLGAPFAMRERLCNMILHHQVPFFLTQRDDAERLATRVSWTAQRCDLLSLVTEADGRGRECADRAQQIENVELFRVFCQELGCESTPRPFQSDEHRVRYFRDSSRHPDAPVAPQQQCEVTVMSGLPGAGKNHWIAHNLAGTPSVSPDDVRAKLKIAPTDNQGLVVQTCREEAREHLRAGRNFVWNATNLSLELRGPLIDLFLDYGARVRIVYVETDEATWLARNRKRREPIPSRTLERMLSRWQVPDATEAHEVVHVAT